MNDYYTHWKNEKPNHNSKSLYMYLLVLAELHTQRLKFYKSITKGMTSDEKYI